MFCFGLHGFCLAVFWGLRRYQSLWHFVSFNDLSKVVVSSAITSVFHTLTITLLKRVPISYYVVGAGIQFFLVLAVRFTYRFILLERSKSAKVLQQMKVSRVMLIGAGAVGQIILRDLHSAQESSERVCCIIDDNSNKWGRFIDGVPIVGGRDDILFNVENTALRISS